jgi:competence protein ComEA
MFIRSLIAAVLTAASFGALAAIDINKASQAELEALPGVGPALATRMLDERKKSPFKDWADLVQRVRGVGDGSAAKLSKGGLTVGGAEYKPAAK